VKRLRAEGVEVQIEPDNGARIEYVFYKGFPADIVASPMVIAAFGILRDVLIGIVSTWLYTKLPPGKSEGASNPVEVEAAGSNIAIEIIEGDKKVRCNMNGAEIDDARFNRIMEMLQTVAAPPDARTPPIKSPYPEMPVPIFLEHTSRIVGWGKVNANEQGLFVEIAQIVDDETYQRNEAGQLKGFSIGAIAKQSECSICGQDYVDCNHLAGQVYDGLECTNTIKKLDLLEVSIVKDPINPMALIKNSRS